MPGLKDDPWQIQRRNWSQFLRSLITGFCAELHGSRMCFLLGAFKSDYIFRALFPLQKAEDPAGTPGVRTCGKSSHTKCNQNFASKELCPCWPCSFLHCEVHPSSVFPTSCSVDVWVHVTCACDKRSDSEQLGNQTSVRVGDTNLFQASRTGWSQTPPGFELPEASKVHYPCKAICTLPSDTHCLCKK